MSARRALEHKSGLHFAQMEFLRRTGRLQGLTTFTGELPACQPAKLSVHRGHQLFQCAPISGAPGNEKFRGCWRGMADHVPDPSEDSAKHGPTPMLPDDRATGKPPARQAVVLAILI
jgi:hypothetical protein